MNAPAERAGSAPADFKKARRRKAELSDPSKGDRLPPHSTEAEQGVLGCVLLSPADSLHRCIENRISPGSFYDLRHQTIYESLLDLYEGDSAIDVIILQQVLRDADQLESVGGLAYLVSLPDATPSAANLDYYLDIVREKQELRNLVTLCTETVGRAYEFTGEIDTLKDELRRDMERVLDRSSIDCLAVRSWMDIRPEAKEIADAILVGPGNWLTRGSGVLFVGPTGSGKSTLDACVTHAFATGRAFIGLVPSRPLKSLVIQAEDDDLDLAEMSRGIIGSLNPTDDERELIRQNVLVVTERASTGFPFLSRVAGLLEKHRPDLLHLNPLSAYFGDDLNDQRAVAAFFRNGLNPLLARHRCGLICVHHTTKPSKERDGWKDGALAYSGSGSADLANWAREVLTLKQTAPGLYELTATKRWRKLGWKDGEGNQTATRLIAHSRDGSQVWADATSDTLAELGATPYTAAGLCALVPAEGIDKAELVPVVMEAFRVSDRTARTYVADGCRTRRHTVDGSSVKCALFSATNRPRREVYPGKPSNRAVVWLTLTEEGERLCKR